MCCLCSGHLYHCGHIKRLYVKDKIWPNICLQLQCIYTSALYILTWMFKCCYKCGVLAGCWLYKEIAEMNFCQMLPYLKLQHICESSGWHFSCWLHSVIVCVTELNHVLAHDKHCHWCVRSQWCFSYVTTGSPLALCSSLLFSVAVAHAVCFIDIQKGFLLNVFHISFSFPPYFIQK